MFLKLALFLLTCCAVHAQELTSFQDIDTTIATTTKQHRPEDVLVLFDVNYTLLLVDHPAMYIPNIQSHPNEMQTIMNGLSKEQQHVVIGCATKAEPQKLVEACIPEAVHKLQKKGTKVLAFSAALSGNLGNIESEEWFYKTLASFGIDFHPSFPTLSPFAFDDFPLYRGNYPTYQKGIVLTNKASKGAVLVSFLNRAAYHPKVVVLIDNKNQNIEEMTAALQAFDPTITFVGLDYTHGMTYVPEKIDTDSFLRWWKALPCFEHP